MPSPNKTYMEYEPLSIAPAAGWAAMYTTDSIAPGWTEEPLIGWAVYEVTQNPTHGSAIREREIHGVVDCGGYFGPPEEAANFWRYRAPGEPDPSPEEVARAQEL